MIAVTESLQTAAATLGLLAGIIASIRLLWNTPLGRFVRWLWRVLVRTPADGVVEKKLVEMFDRPNVTSSVKSVIFQALDERLMAPNGGKSLFDIAAKVDRLEASNNQRNMLILEGQQRFGHIEETLKATATEVNAVSKRVEEMYLWASQQHTNQTPIIERHESE